MAWGSAAIFHCCSVVPSINETRFLYDKSLAIKKRYFKPADNYGPARLPPQGAVPLSLNQNSVPGSGAAASGTHHGHLSVQYVETQCGDALNAMQSTFQGRNLLGAIQAKYSVCSIFHYCFLLD
jgi:hypothetical protein